MVRHDDARKRALDAARAESKILYEALAAPFPEEAIERTEGRVTGRGYDTTGIKYQYVVNRLNEVLGLGGWRARRELTVKEVLLANKDRMAYEAICEITLELGEWVDGTFIVFAESLGDGGHRSFSLADARKGAYTNAFKKAAAFFGCGRQAYEGSIDDDNVPEERAEERSPFSGNAPPERRAEPRREPQPQPQPTPRPALREVRRETEKPSQQPDQPEMTAAERAKANAVAARDRQIFDEAVKSGLKPEAFHAWAEKMIGRPYQTNTEWTEDDRSHLEAEILSRMEAVKMMNERPSLRNSPTPAPRNGRAPVPAPAE